jgi:hypothetical protein
MVYLRQKKLRRTIFHISAASNDHLAVKIFHMVGHGICQYKKTSTGYTGTCANLLAKTIYRVVAGVVAAGVVVVVAGVVVVLVVAGAVVAVCV